MQLLFTSAAGVIYPAVIVHSSPPLAALHLTEGGGRHSTPNISEAGLLGVKELQELETSAAVHRQPGKFKTPRSRTLPPCRMWKVFLQL